MRHWGQVGADRNQPRIQSSWEAVMGLAGKKKTDIQANGLK